MPRGHAVNGVGILGNLDSPARQLISKAYRARPGRPRGRGQLGEALGELPGGGDERLPEASALSVVEGGEDLAAAGVEHGQGFASTRLDQRPPKGVEGAGASGRQAGARGQPARRREADADADEGARSLPHGQRAHLAPTAAGLDRALHLGEQGRGVPRAPIGREPEQPLVHDLAVAQGADGRVGGRRVEADDRLPLGAQLSQ